MRHSNLAKITPAASMLAIRHGRSRCGPNPGKEQEAGGPRARAWKRRACGFVMTWLLCSTPLAASGTEIFYEAHDLADATPGTDLWQYSYSVQDFVFPAGFGFSILFDYTRYGRMEPPAPAGDDWDVIVLQPDPALPADGLYDALALMGSPSLSNAFVQTFVWLGPGTPESQPFAVYDSSFQTIDTGLTAVPEPSTGMLMTIALLTAGWIRRHRSVGVGGSQR